MEKKWFVGIDVSKNTLDVVVYDPKKKHCDASNYHKFPNDSEGFHAIRSWLSKSRIKLPQTVFCMENTGIYSYDLCLYLEACSADYCAFMPLALKRSMGLVRGKNDRVDAERIAYYGYLHREELKYTKMADSVIIRLRELSSERKRYVKELAGYKASLTDNGGREQTSSLLRFSTLAETLDKLIADVEKEMLSLVSSDEALKLNYMLLCSIKGISLVNAVNTIVHTNNFTGFENARQYACYLGIAPFEHSSGSSVRGRTRVCPTGARMLKADLSQAAKSAAEYDSGLRAYYEKKRKEGKEYGVVLNAIKFKLVCKMFAVIRRGTPYVDGDMYES